MRLDIINVLVRIEINIQIRSVKIYKTLMQLNHLLFITADEPCLLGMGHKKWIHLTIAIFLFTILKSILFIFLYQNRY